MKNVRSSQPCTSMNFCTEFSKAKVFPYEYREVNISKDPYTHFKLETGFHQ